MTDLYAVIGNPVEHSRSPLIHAEFARQTRQPVSYGKLYAEIAGFEAVVQRFREEGGRGVNVTVPFKRRAYALASSRSRRAEEAQAVNTLSFEADGIKADNTDGVGLVRDLTRNLGCAIQNRRVLVMGAGGAAYGVCGPLLDAGPATLVVANRTPDKAVDLATRFAGLFPAAPEVTGAGYAELEGREFDLVINATSAGLSGEMPALPAGVFAPGALAYDMVYGKDTPFLALAARAGARAADGLGMLVEQAAESFYLWRGMRPDTAPVIELLRGTSKC
jgi:shikimate dehydrogenase